MLEREFALTHCTHDPLFQLVDACGWAYRCLGRSMEEPREENRYSGYFGVDFHTIISAITSYIRIVFVIVIYCDVHKGGRVLSFVPDLLAKSPECPGPRLSRYPSGTFEARQGEEPISQCRCPQWSTHAAWPKPRSSCLLLR